MEQALHLQPILTLLIIGILAVVVMRPLHMSPIVGYLLAGMLIGEHGFGWIEESETTHLLAELGVVFLLFDIGLHFSIAHIWDARRDILGLGPLQIVLTTLLLAILAVLFASISLEVAIVAGATLALSSTAVAAQILADNQQSSCPVSVSATAVLIFQDICAIFLLILANSLGGNEAALISTIGLAALKAVAAFGTAIMLGRFLISPLFQWIASYKDDEVFTATALFIVLATAAATGLLELSLTLGAFLAGMIISETRYRHIIQTEVKPFRGLLLGFFFITVGMTLNLDVLFDRWGEILLVTLALVGLKAMLIYVAARLLGTPARSALQMGILLSQGSEFAFVIFAIPAVKQVLGTEYAAILIISVAASMALTPILVLLGRKLARKWADEDWNNSRTQTDNKPSDTPVIIVGMAEVGRRVANALDAHDLPYRSIEVNHDCFMDACTNGYNVGFGDATDLRLMHTIKMSHAQTIVITFSNYEISSQLTPLVLEKYPDLNLMVAVKDEAARKRFNALGMQAVIQRSFPRGLDMAVAVLARHDVDAKKIYSWMQRQQSSELADMFSPSALGSIAGK